MTATPPKGFLSVNLDVTIPEGHSIRQVVTLSADAFGQVTADTKVVGEVDRLGAAAQLRILADLIELGQ